MRRVHRAHGSVPESAKLAPADAVGFVTVVTDESSEQWEKADRLLGLFPDARVEVLGAVRTELAQEDLTWKDDVAPALGDELVVVVTAARKPVVLVQPESADALSALIAQSDDPLVQGTVSGWTALAETQAELDAYRAALGRGTLDGVESFSDAMTGLPEEALVRGWVDFAALARDLASAFEQSGVQGELGVDWLAAALTAEDDGVHFSVGVRTPGGNGSSYEPELFERVPADAVAALSFGGTQGTLDRIEGAVDVDAVSSALEDAVGVSLDGLLEALSGEGLLYVRKGGEDLPEVTVVLAPPDPAKTFDTVDRVARTLARETGAEVRTRTDGGLTLHELTAEGISLDVCAGRRLRDGDDGADGNRGLPRRRPEARRRRRVRERRRPGRARRPDARLRVRRHRRSRPARREPRRPGCGAGRGTRRARDARLAHPPGERRRRDDDAQRLPPRHPLSIARTGNAPAHRRLRLI